MKAKGVAIVPDGIEFDAETNEFFDELEDQFFKGQLNFQKIKSDWTVENKSRTRSTTISKLIISPAKVVIDAISSFPQYFKIWFTIEVIKPMPASLNIISIFSPLNQ